MSSISNHSNIPLYKGPELRQWQLEAIDAWEKHYNGIIQAVPGAGKTILAVRMLTQKLESESNLKVLIVCPRLTLIQQWVDAICEYSNIKPKEIYEVSSNNESKAYVCAQGKLDNYKVFISTFHQIKQFFNECKWKDHDWFLIVDEMHNTTENYKFPNAPIKYKLGLSATPKKKGKDSDFNLGGIVYTYSFSQALSDKIILDPVIKIVFYSVNKNLFKKIQNEKDATMDLVESAYDDFLPDDELESEHKAFVAQQSVLEENQAHSSKELLAKNVKDFSRMKHLSKKELEKLKDYSKMKHLSKKELEKLKDYSKMKHLSKKELAFLAKKDLEEKALASEAEEAEPDVFTSKNTDFVGIQKILENQFHIGKKNSVQTLVFVNRIKKADLLNQMLAEKFDEKVSHSYHSKSEKYNTKNHFNNLKQDFAQGKFNVLISVGTLGEGIDFPYASHGIIASPIYNPTSFVQKVGRLLRSYKDHKKATIYYYVPSELITRLLTDERIEPNYFKSVLKIADENKDLYFVDRQSLGEEKGSLSELLIQGAAYERNEDIKRIKIPYDLDSIMRFFKRVYPENLKDWRKFYAEQLEALEKEKQGNASAEKEKGKGSEEIAQKSKEILSKNKKGAAGAVQEKEGRVFSPQKELDFSLLRNELSKNHSIMLSCADNLAQNFQSVVLLQKKFSSRKFKDFDNVKHFVKEALKQKIITKIKFGQELEKIASEDKSVLSLSEQEMLVNMIAAELHDFCSKQSQLEKILASISSSIEILEKHSKTPQSNLKVIAKNISSRSESEAVTERISAMSRLSKSYFDLQSLFLDELDLADLAKNASTKEKKFFLTIGRDIFLTKQIPRKFSYPEDFGLSRWREEKEAPVPVIVLSPIEKFAKRLMHLMGEEEKTKGEYLSLLANWHALKNDICSFLKIPLQDDSAILKELEKHKLENEFSFEKIFFLTEAIKRQKKH